MGADRTFEVTNPGDRAPLYDCVFLSYDEPLANVLYQRLTSVIGPAKRLHGVRGMRRAYRLTAELVDTEYYLIADGDFEVDLDFAADAAGPMPDDVSLRVWTTRNPVNGLEYGYGGIKLCRRSAMQALGDAVDVLAALPGRKQFLRTVAGTTRFNQSPYHAWRAGFRECSMMARGCEYGSTEAAVASRLDAWTTGVTHG
jgi:hypothetical protein